MDIVSCLILLLLGYIAIQAIRFVYADADLTLLWHKKFGRSKASLAGQVVWITGASSGIGESLAYALSRVGCKLILSARSEQKLQQVKKLCREYGRLKDNDVLILPLDLMDFESHKEAANTAVSHFRKIDVLVNNAGRSQKGMAQRTSLLVDREVLNTNFLGTVSLTKAVVPYMARAKGGHILVTSSIAGKVGSPLQAAYSASKFALQGWFEAFRIEVASFDINITLALPGPVFSNIRKAAFSETPGLLVNEDIPATEHRMTSERCAELMAIAVANNLPEVWISPQPVLLFCYMAQYCPVLVHWLAPMLGMKAIHTLRYGTNALQQSTFPIKPS